MTDKTLDDGERLDWLADQLWCGWEIECSATTPLVYRLHSPDHGPPFTASTLRDVIDKAAAEGES